MERYEKKYPTLKESDILNESFEWFEVLELLLATTPIVSLFLTNKVEKLDEEIQKFIDKHKGRFKKLTPEIIKKMLKKLQDFNNAEWVKK